MTLFQTYPGESDTDVRTAIDAILQSLDSARPQWWHPYELRGSYRIGDVLYREFWCVAGSLHFWLQKLAREDGARSVILLNRGDAKIEPVR